MSQMETGGFRISIDIKKQILQIRGEIIYKTTLKFSHLGMPDQKNQTKSMSLRILTLSLQHQTHILLNFLNIEIKFRTVNRARRTLAQHDSVTEARRADVLYCHVVFLCYFFVLYYLCNIFVFYFCVIFSCCIFVIYFSVLL